jgi:hypothetical protein
MAMERPAWVVSIMACSWTTRIVPFAVLLSIICEKHLLFWRPYFVVAGAWKDHDQEMTNVQARMTKEWPNDKRQPRAGFVIGSFEH